MPAATFSKDDRYLTYLSLLFGGAAMVAYPAAGGRAVAILLAFGAPMAIATTGRLARNRVWQSAALVYGLVLFVSLVLAIMASTTILLEMLILIGGPVALLVVGRMIRLRDRPAAVVWFALSAAAYVIGIWLAVAGARGLGVTPALIAVATVFAGLRIARSFRTEY